MSRLYNNYSYIRDVNALNVQCTVLFEQQIKIIFKDMTLAAFNTTYVAVRKT